LPLTEIVNEDEDGKLNACIIASHKNNVSQKRDDVDLFLVAVSATETREL
jgi:hypothetical protein